MGETTAIEWTGPNGKTWSPWFGCAKVHTGCTNCYAEEDNNRYKRNGGTWGKGAPRRLRKDWDAPLKWARDAARAGERWKVFPSLCDPFDAEAPEGALGQFAHLIWVTARVCGECGPTLEAGHDFGCSRPAARQGGLDWLLLTKRPERAGFPGDWEHLRRLVWLLVSISDQATADEYIPPLLASDGWAVRGVSYEPAVGPLALRPTWTRGVLGGAQVPGLDWVIAGGESGAKRRPCETSWFDRVADDCARTSTPFFMKQDSAFLPSQRGRLPDALWSLKQFPRMAP